MSDTPRVTALLDRHRAEDQARGKVSMFDAGRQIRELIDLAQELERDLRQCAAAHMRRDLPQQPRDKETP